MVENYKCGQVQHIKYQNIEITEVQQFLLYLLSTLSVSPPTTISLLMDKKLACWTEGFSTADLNFPNSRASLMDFVQ